MADIVYCYNNEVYFNLTNNVLATVLFVSRNNGDSVGEAKNLWFEKEPTMEEIYEAIDSSIFPDIKKLYFAVMENQLWHWTNFLRSASICEENIRHILGEMESPVRELSYV